MTRVVAVFDQALPNPHGPRAHPTTVIALKVLVASPAARNPNCAITHRVYPICWCLLVAYHFVNAVFVFLQGAVHVYISHPAIYANVWLLRVDPTILFLGGWSLLFVAIAHTIALVRIVGYSVWQRRLNFGRDDMRVVRPEVLEAVKPRTSLLQRVCFPVTWVKRLIGETGTFGAFGDYFYVGFYIRQVVEISMQTFQAYQFSLSVAKASINVIVVAVIVANCAFVPIVNCLLRGHPSGRRAALLTIDILLDFVLLVVIPMLSLTPYAFQFDWSARRFDPALTYDDIWFTNAVSEVRQAMISSGLDYVSTLFPHVTGLLTLHTIRGLIQRAATSERHAAARLDSTLTIFTQARVKPTKLVRATAIAFHVFCIGWLGFTLSSHMTAQLRRHRAPSDACALRGHAWYATQDTCFVVKVNCYRRGIQGDRDSIAAALGAVDLSTVSRLIISHCPALQIPREVTHLSALMALEIFNSTLVDWPHDAALTETTTPLMSQLHFVATNFTRFPDAILRNDLPPHLGLIIFQSNLSELPDNVGAVWAPFEWKYSQIEHSRLTTLPSTFPSVRSARLSLIYNQLQSFRANDFASSTVLTSLRLSGNNDLTTLPDVPPSTTFLYQIMAENTNISTLPAWFESWWATRHDVAKALVVSFQGSPVCVDPVHAELCARVPDADSGDFRIDLVHALRTL